MTDHGPVIPDHYPYVDEDPNATCRWFFHGKATVRTVWLGPGQLVERYDCRCGKFYWLSQDDLSGPWTGAPQHPLVRYRATAR